MAKGKKKDALAQMGIDISPVKFADGVAYRKNLEDVPTFFANVSTLRAGGDDISIIFSQQYHRTEEALEVIPQAVIYLTPKHTELLIGLLQKALQARTEHLEKAGS